MNRMHRRGLPTILAVAIAGGVVLTPLAAKASEEGKRNTTLALGAATAYLFTKKGDKTPAFIGAAATAYAYKKYDDSIKDRHRREASRQEVRRFRRDDPKECRHDDPKECRHDNGRHDNGLHKGWYKNGKHKGTAKRR
jgi:hypothetical protein